MPKSTEKMFGTIWTYDGSGPYMALYSAPDGKHWVFIDLTDHHASGYVKTLTLSASGFYGGDPAKRLFGYEQLEDAND